MARIIIDSVGDKVYYDNMGRWHREDGPAYISKNGHKEWSYEDFSCRDDGPAIITSDGVMIWEMRDERLRKIVRLKRDEPNGHKFWGTSVRITWPKL